MLLKEQILKMVEEYINIWNDIDRAEELGLTEEQVLSYEDKALELKRQIENYGIRYFTNEEIFEMLTA